MRFNRILSAAALMVPGIVGAQAPSPEWPIAPGSRVRLVSPVLGDQRQTGIVASSTTDTLVFRAAARDATPIAIATPNIARIEVASGTHSRKAKGALVGFLVGAGAGALLGAATYKKPKPCVGWCFYPFEDSRGVDAAIAGFLGGTVGAITGAIIGARPTDSWVPVAVPRR
jgi:hypothetical protein